MTTKGGPRAISFIDLKAQYRRLKPLIAANIEAVLEHGQYINGPEIARLEAALEKLTGASHAVGVASGTDALIMPLLARGIGPGDAVFLPAFTYNATANAVLLVGARPVFVDVEPDTFTIDVEKLAQAIERVGKTRSPKPRAIIPVDLFGLPADYPAIHALAARHGLFVLADAAQSLGGKQGGKYVGALAPVTATSFFPSKTLGGYGDGGAIFCDSAAEAEVFRSLRWHGTDEARKESIRVGLNGRLDSLQAAVLLAKLTIFAEERARRQVLARAYDAALGGAVTRQRVPQGRESGHALYCVLVKDRDQLRDALNAKGIPTAVYYSQPLHLHAAFKACGEGAGSLPVCEDLSRRILALPFHPYLSDEEVEQVAHAVRAAQG
jgi:dTDP-4-amino-4,6-dideoxygalactose transaminase